MLTPALKHLAENKIFKYSVWILTAIIPVIIVNRADSLFLEVTELEIVLIALTTSIVTAALLTWIVIKLRQSLGLSSALNELDEMFTTLIGIRLPKSEDNIDRSLNYIIKRASKIVGSNCRISVLLKDLAKPEILRVRYSTEPSNLNKVFFVSKNSISKDVVRQAYLEGKRQIRKLENLNPHNRSKEIQGYLPHPSKGPPCSSLICQPIPATIGYDPSYLGVLCIDSPDEGSFDLRETQTLIMNFAIRIGAALTIAEFGKNYTDTRNL